MKRILIFALIVIFLTNCGIKYTTYFQEPVLLEVPDSANGTELVYFHCTAYNNEEDENENLLAGYDLYYFFSISDLDSDSRYDTPQTKAGALKAQVYYPNNLSSGRNSDLYNFPGSEPSRFPPSDFTDTEVYEDISIPVTDSMIDDILSDEDNDENLEIHFYNYAINDGNNNPYKDSGSGTVIMDEVYPNQSEYSGEDWETDYLGFLDKDFYDYYGINPLDGEGGVDYEIYRVYFYLKAKGFNSNEERSPSEFVYSDSSSSLEVKFKVYNSTETP
ncbi:MAG: hypothetical protein MJB14_24050 [Spirochaetes bacterium]|nr:hypothetical protein [Spirochaetota bacterium]